MADYNFLQTLQSAGIPTDEAAAEETLQQIVSEQDFHQFNTSEISPFWRLLRAIFIKPYLAIINTLASSVMPNAFLKTAAGTALDTIAWQYGITRKQSVKARYQIRVTKRNSADVLVLPKGTRVLSIPVNDVQFVMITQSALTIAQNVLTASVVAIAENPGADYNLGENAYCLLEESNPLISSVINTGDFVVTLGADAESDDQLRLRTRNAFLSAAGEYTNAKYAARVAQTAGINVDDLYFDNTAPRGPGTCDIYILSLPSASLSTLCNTITASIMAEGNHGHGDSVQVKSFPVLDCTLAVTIAFKQNTDAAIKPQRLGEIQSFIRCAFRENTLFSSAICTRTQPHATFSLSTLFAELHAQYPELADITAVASPSPITTTLQIPHLTTLTVLESA